MKVLAAGAAGASAGLVTRALADRGVEVTGLVHRADQEQAARDNGAAHVVVADLGDRGALVAAAIGMDGVFHVIPAFAANETGIGSTMVAAAVEAGVPRFVFSSVYHPSLTDLSNHRDKQPGERALIQSPLDFSILQPAMFMSQLDDLVADARGTGVISGPYSTRSAMSYVDYRDVAEVVAIAFTTDRLRNGTFELSGPGTYSRDDVAALLGDLLGKPVRAEKSAPPTAATDGPAGDNDPMAAGLAKMFDHYDRYGFHGGNSLVLDTILGRPAQSVPGYLRAMVGRTADEAGIEPGRG